MRRLGGTLLALAIAICLLRNPLAPGVGLVLAAAGALLVDRAVLRAVLRVGITLAIFLAAALTGAVVAWSAGPGRGLEIGGTMLLRLLVLLIVTGVLSRAVSSETIVRATRRLGIERLGLVLGLSLNTLPRLAEAVHEAWLAMQVRIRSRSSNPGSGHTRVRRRIATWLRLVRELPGLAEAVLAHTARIAEEAAAAAALRGHAGVMTGQVPVAVPVRMVVVTGATGSGKTSAVIAAIGELVTGGRQVAGFVQPGVWDEGKKTGFSIRDVATGEETMLARRVERDSGQYGTSFRFADSGFELARKALAAAAPGTVLVVDELGPMELRGHGHMRAVKKALTTDHLAGVVVVVRRHLVPSLLAALAAPNAVVIDIQAEGTRAPQAILAALHPTATHPPGMRLMPM
jgi:nucleoside-triphosphatase